jgi:threonine dehydrogenase-like Zn-dependent dehydrogenase
MVNAAQAIDTHGIITLRTGSDGGSVWVEGQTHVNRWTDDLLRRIERGQIDPSFVITRSVRLEDGPAMYETFRDKQDGCIKVVLKP